MTTAVRTPPHHNNLNCYKRYDCRLPACVERHRAYGRTVTRLQAYGVWQPYVDAEPARQHILDMRQEGITLARVAELTGLSLATVGAILYTKGNRPRRKYLRTEHANRILAITPEHAAPGFIDATGTRRRIEALQVAGWPKQVIARRLGLNVHTAGRVTRQDTVRAGTAHAVAALYADLKVKMPEHHGITPWVADRARRHAHAQGWHGHLAWDATTIDDPNAQPDLTDAPNPELKRDELAALRRDEIWLLHTACHSDEEIAARVGMSPSSVTAIRQELRTGKKRDRSKKQEAVS